MSIDEKRLDELEQLANEVNIHIGATQGMDPAFFQSSKELIRLARLGLWAEKQAIPALKERTWAFDSTGFDSDDERVVAALAALPKGGK
jgi:hypothetical protein